MSIWEHTLGTLCISKANGLVAVLHARCPKSVQTAISAQQAPGKRKQMTTKKHHNTMTTCFSFEPHNAIAGWFGKPTPTFSITLDLAHEHNRNHIEV